MASPEEIARLVITIEGQVKDLKRDLGVVNNEVKKTSKSIGGSFAMIRKNWLAVTGALYLIRRNTKDFLEFKQRLNEVNTLLDVSSSQFKALEKVGLGKPILVNN